MKTICAFRVPFICRVSETDRPVMFHIRFGIIEGILPFLIGLPSLLAMKWILNFQYSSLSLIIRQATYRLQLQRRSSNLRLPLVYDVTHRQQF